MAVALFALAVHYRSMAQPSVGNRLKARLEEALEPPGLLDLGTDATGLPIQEGSARSLRPRFEALAAAYLAFCDEEREAWLGAEPGELAELGARALLPLAQEVLRGEAGDPGAQGLDPWEAALSAWALMDGAIRAALAKHPLASCGENAKAAARSLEYMLAGLAEA